MWDERTDGRTDRRMDRVKPIYPPTTSLGRGIVTKSFDEDLWLDISQRDETLNDVLFCVFWRPCSAIKKIIGPDQALKGLYQVPPKQLPGLSQRHWLFKQGCFGGNYWSGLSLTEDSGCHMSSQVYDMKMALSDKFLLNMITLMSQMLTKVVLPIKNMRPSNRTIYP